MSGPLDFPATANPGASHLFFGIGVGDYNHPETYAPLNVAEDVEALAKVMGAYRYTVLPSPPHPTVDQAFKRLDALAGAALADESCLVVLWAGHGEPTDNGDLHLVSRNSRPGQTMQITSSQMVAAALRSGASQILVLLDTCYAETGAVEAMALARRIELGLPNDGTQRWIGILPAALAYETARDGVFSAQLLQLLREGPSDPELRLRWSAHNAGIRGDDVIDCLVKQWRSLDQTLVPVMRGNAGVMLPNPRYDALAPDVVVEQLLLAARGGQRQRGGRFFHRSGRATGGAGGVDRSWRGGRGPGERPGGLRQIGAAGPDHCPLQSRGSATDPGAGSAGPCRSGGGQRGRGGGGAGGEFGRCGAAAGGGAVAQRSVADGCR